MIPRVHHRPRGVLVTCHLPVCRAALSKQTFWMGYSAWANESPPIAIAFSTQWSLRVRVAVARGPSPVMPSNGVGPGHPTLWSRRWFGLCSLKTCLLLLLPQNGTIRYERSLIGREDAMRPRGLWVLPIIHGGKVTAQLWNAQLHSRTRNGMWSRVGILKCYASHRKDSSVVVVSLQGPLSSSCHSTICFNGV